MAVKNELTVLKQLRDIIDAGLNPVTPVTPKTADVVIDFPDVDEMPFKSTVYLLPDYAEYETLATTNDRAEFRVQMFILAKRDTQANLAEKVYGIYNSIYDLLRKDMDLSGYVDFTEVRNATFYPAVEMNKNVQGIEASVAITYTKDF